MKKTLTILLAALLMLGIVLPGTALAEGEQAPEAYGFKTVGDTYAYAPDGPANYGEICICVFEKDGVWYRAEADVPAEVNEKIEAMEWTEDYDAQVLELYADLPVQKVVVLSDLLLSQEELDALAGKTGQELTDMGFVPADEFTFGEADTTIALAKGPFVYTVTFTEAVEPQRVPNLVEVMASLTVKSAAFSGELSYYAWELEFDPNGGPVYEYIAPPSFPIPEIALEDSPFKTLLDVLTLEKGSYSSSMSDGLYVIAFETNGAYYRVEAEITPQIVEATDAIDFFDEERDQKLEALLGPLPVSRVGDISACLPTQEEMDALVGKTGQELADMGFEQGTGYSFWDKAEFYLTKDLFEYHVFFNEKVPEMEDYDAVIDEILASLTVEKAEVFGLSGVCSDPDLVW